jgi:GTP-binding protein
LIPADSEDHFQEFKILENELKEYNPELLDKDFIISISKADLLDEELRKEISAEFPENKQPIFFSGVTGEGLMELKDVIWKHLHG